MRGDTNIEIVRDIAKEIARRDIDISERRYQYRNSERYCYRNSERRDSRRNNTLLIVPSARTITTSTKYKLGIYAK